MRTKWEVLLERQIAAQQKADDIRKDMEWMQRTECGLTCNSCGTLLETEASFAQHFVIPDERYLNLGNCPIKNQGLDYPS